MGEQIKNIRLKFSCNADWDNMISIDGIKHCDHCQKKVYDFIDAKHNEFLKILAENNNNICGRFLPEQMARKHPALPAWKQWLSAAMVLVGINIFNNRADAQDTKPKITNQSRTKIDSNAVFGGVDPIQPTFPGGMSAYKDFLLKNLHYDKGMLNGKVLVYFEVKPDGSLNNLRILKGLSKLNDDEVIRVFKLSPKWVPALLNGKPVLSNYSVPVLFQNN
ncbi:energy transducer TonB [Mucilaginibacter sp. X5P1]|uniref:energy transducer TonB n=1 Tax=Mucilaginibacter sp. X5P1 TaxID=2723088 RepID=UPI00161CFD7F|nr:energy transducer TonB [Mucilaginibacter sp. X5P1]MBB6140291.1 hypothetical protein [Mucilaginibacter sp. X5P1]